MKQVPVWIKSQPVRFWIYLAGFFAALLIFEEVADDVFADPLEGDVEAIDFDRSISAFVQATRTLRRTQTMTDLTALGSVSVILMLFLIFASVLVTFRDWKGLLYLGVVLAGAGTWPLVLKKIYLRPRPDLEMHLVNVSDLSFPSGHSFGAATVYLALAIYGARYAKNLRHEIFFCVLGVFVISVVGLSRIYLGVHYPTDVLAGLAGGAAWGFAVSAIFAFRLEEPKLTLNEESRILTERASPQSTR